MPDGNYTISCVCAGDVVSWSWGETQSGSSNFEVKAPRDVATGQSSGKRQHKPLTITKEFDKATPMLGKQAGSPKSTKNQNSARSNNRCVAAVIVDGTCISGTISDK